MDDNQFILDDEMRNIIHQSLRIPTNCDDELIAFYYQSACSLIANAINYRGMPPKLLQSESTFKHAVLLYVEYCYESRAKATPTPDQLPPIFWDYIHQLQGKFWGKDYESLEQ